MQLMNQDGKNQKQNKNNMTNFIWGLLELETVEGWMQGKNQKVRLATEYLWREVLQTFLYQNNALIKYTVEKTSGWDGG